MDAVMYAYHCLHLLSEWYKFESCTRGNQKVLQFSMMYKWHRQNNYFSM